MPSNVRVAVRVRPLLQHEVQSGQKQTLLEVNTHSNQISVSQDSQEDAFKLVRKNFRFDKIIDSQYSQEEVFDQLQIRGLIGKVMEGFHATIFAYGQTGSGKTFTMEGYKYEEAQKNERAGKAVIEEGFENGITIRSIREVFKQAQEMRKEKHITISCSFLQIYNEKVYDLLNAGMLKKGKPGGAADQGLRIRWNKNEQFTVENLYVFKCDSPEHALTLYNKGVKNKIVASHNLNHASSRSHCIFTLTLEMVDNASVDNTVVSKLQLVDLAGSERQSATGTSGLAQKESIDINKSLFTLRQVITGLADASKGGKKALSLQHIPYRDSKLTCLLKQSIGGNSYCLMIACLSPSDMFVEENLSTLTYATKASYISNEPVKNEDPKMRVINELKQKVVNLQKELAQANNHIEFLSNLTGQPLPQGGEIQGGSANEMKMQVESRVETPLKQEEQVAQQKKPTTEVISKPQQVKGPTQGAPDYEAFHRLGQDQLSQRLIESVAMVKELMSSNRTLRDTIDTLTSQNDQHESDLYHLQVENRDLRDRIEILESVIASTTQGSEDLDSMDWRQLLLMEDNQINDSSKVMKGGANAKVVQEMAGEMVEQKKVRRGMEEEIERLRQEVEGLRGEQQIFMQQQQFTNGLRQSQTKSISSQQQMINIYSGGQQTQSKHSGIKHQQSAPLQQQQQIMQNQQMKQGVGSQVAPQSKQEALKMLNDMMNKRLQNRQPNSGSKQQY